MYVCIAHHSSSVAVYTEWRRRVSIMLRNVSGGMPRQRRIFTQLVFAVGALHGASCAVNARSNTQAARSLDRAVEARSCAGSGLWGAVSASGPGGQISHRI
eukprot:COSAG01_NODE_50079_length_366_cov_1.546816_1_plen_101_part_00